MSRNDDETTVRYQFELGVFFVLASYFLGHSNLKTHSDTEPEEDNHPSIPYSVAAKYRDQRPAPLTRPSQKTRMKCQRIQEHNTARDITNGPQQIIQGGKKVERGRKKGGAERQGERGRGGGEDTMTEWNNGVIRSAAAARCARIHHNAHVSAAQRLA